MRVFNEIQKFSQNWLRLILIIVGGLAVIPVIIMSDWQAMETSEMLLLLGSIGMTLIILVFVLFLFRLESRIDDVGVHFGFFPIPGKMNTISWQQIDKIYIRKYSPISEYGGWGYRINFNRSKGKAYNISGDTGIQLELIDKRKILIGTQKQDLAQSTISYHTQKNEL